MGASETWNNGLYAWALGDAILLFLQISLKIFSLSVYSKAGENYISILWAPFVPLWSCSLARFACLCVAQLLPGLIPLSLEAEGRKDGDGGSTIVLCHFQLRLLTVPVALINFFLFLLNEKKVTWGASFSKILASWMPYAYRNSECDRFVFLERWCLPPYSAPKEQDDGGRLLSSIFEEARVRTYRDRGSVEPGSEPTFDSVSGSEN